MNRFNQYQQRPPPPPHLNVHSQNLVYLTAVPTSIGLKMRITNQFGQVKFVETFEAWLGQRTGNIVIDFSAYEDSEAFMTAVIKGRVDFLDGVRIQHIAIVGPRNFFELVRRNTGIDLFSRDGKPNPDWIRIRHRQNRPSTGAKPYDRLPSRGNHPAGTGTSRIPVVLNALTSRPNPFYFYENSTSEEDEMVGPFPSSSSASIRREPGQKRRTFGGRQ